MSREKRNKVLEIICLISEFVLKYGKLTNQTYLYIKRHNILENLNKNYNMKQRIEFIDLAKGICMSLVVYSHVYLGDHPKLGEFQDYISLPLFFSLSGLLFKTYNDYMDFCINKINKLIIPLLCGFLILNIPMLYYLNHRLGLPITFPDDFWQSERIRFIFKGNGPLWFLWALFLQNIIFYSIFLFCRQKTKPIIITCVTLGVSTFWLGKNNIYIPLWIDASLVTLPFFMTGYLMRNYSNILYEPFNKKHSAIAICSRLLLILIYLYDSNLTTTRNIIMHGDNHYEISCASMYIGGLCGTMFVLMISKWLTHLPVISYIGRYCIVVLLTHVVLIQLMRKLLYHFPINTDYIDLIMFGIFAVVIIIEIPIIHFGVKYVPYMFAEKVLIKIKHKE